MLIVLSKRGVVSRGHIVDREFIVERHIVDFKTQEHLQLGRIGRDQSKVR